MTTTEAMPETDGAEKIKRDIEQRNRRLAWSTLIVMIAFAVAKIISVAQIFIIADRLGAGKDLDAYVSANRVPELLVVLIAGGALGHAFIPIFSGYLARDDKIGAWRLASQVVNTVFVVALVSSAIAFLIAPWLMQNVIASGFDAATSAKAVELMRILLISTIIFSVSGLVMPILQSHNHFLLPALAPIMYDVGVLFGVVFLLPQMGITGVAAGALVGAALHLIIQLPGLYHFRAQWFRETGFRDPTLRRVLKLMIPRIIGLGVFQFNFLVMNNIASRLGTGSVSALDWGWRLMQIPQTLVGTAMGIVIFPTLAALSEVGNLNGKRDAMSGALRFILVASIPSAVGLIVIGQPMISLLERGEFTASTGMLVYSTLRAFTLGLIVHSILEVVARSFYADKDTITPLWAALGGAAINLVLSFVLSDMANAGRYSLYNAAVNLQPALNLKPEIGNVSGLALANSLGTAFEVIALLWILRKRWHGIHENALARTTLKTLASSLVMALAVLAIEFAWNALGLANRGFMFTVAQLGIQVLVGGIVFAAVAFALKMEELNELLKLIFRRRSATPEVVPA
jgi:putative peptidoglycan lipid II flippase